MLASTRSPIAISRASGRARPERLHWSRRWSRVCKWDPPWVKWFLGGRLNAAYNCLDRHVATHPERVAYFWEGEPGDTRRLTYRDLHAEVGRFANALRKLGVRRGDRVAIYLGMVPELPVAMLACARIGAVHSVVFGGFAADALRDRIDDADAEIVITADGAWRRGKIVPLKASADEAVKACPSIRAVVVVRRTGETVPMTPGRDLWYHDLVEGETSECSPEEMDAEDPLYILYTSGTTGKPKGILHTTGGYLLGVSTTHRLIFDIHPEEDIYWCAADIGWVTGHSYIVYGPLANGTTSILYEGAPDYPDKDRWWSIAEKYRATILYTAPTAIRAFMKWGPGYPARHDLSSLRLLGTVGEPINPVAANQGGYLVLRRPWPAQFRTIYGSPERYVEQDFSKFGKGIYVTGDGAKRDDDGDFWLLGRIDDVMNVAGHRLSTFEIESALVDHRAVAESAVVSRPDPDVGEAIVAFVTLKAGVNGDEKLIAELREHVAKKIGKLARPHAIVLSADLPKTRSGKILRRLLRDVARGRALGDVTTLANAEVVEEIRSLAKTRHEE